MICLSSDVSTIRLAGIKSIKFSQDLGGAGGTTDPATSLSSSIIRERERERERERLRVSMTGTVALLLYIIFESHRGEFPAV